MDSQRPSSMMFPSQNGLKPETGGVNVTCTVVVFIGAANSTRTSLAGLIPVAPSWGYVSETPAPPPPPGPFGPFGLPAGPELHPITSNEQSTGAERTDERISLRGITERLS